MKVIFNLAKNVLWNFPVDLISPGSRTKKRLKEDSEGGGQFAFDAQKDKLIVFSDLHRGIRKERGDRFNTNAGLYKEALVHYLKNGYRLVLLGDVEEGWGYWGEMDKIFASYKDVLDLEREFIKEGRYYRVYGNHDDYWRKPGRVNKFFNQDPQIANKIQAYPAVTFNDNGNKIVMVHGCQGHNFQDVGDALARFFVHLKVDVFKCKTKKHPIERRKKMRKQEERVFNWANEKKSMVVMGHTHTIYFNSLPNSYFEDRRITNFKKKLSKKISDIERKETEDNIRILKEITGLINEQRKQIKEKGEGVAPGVFNSGNCCVSEKEISGIEIADGEVRLVFWEKDPTLREVVEKESLEKIFKTIHK